MIHFTLNEPENNNRLSTERCLLCLYHHNHYHEFYLFVARVGVNETHQQKKKVSTTGFFRFIRISCILLFPIFRVLTFLENFIKKFPRRLNIFTQQWEKLFNGIIFFPARIFFIFPFFLGIFQHCSKRNITILLPFN